MPIKFLDNDGTVRDAEPRHDSDKCAEKIMALRTTLSTIHDLTLKEYALGTIPKAYGLQMKKLIDAALKTKSDLSAAPSVTA